MTSNDCSFVHINISVCQHKININNLQKTILCHIIHIYIYIRIFIFCLGSHNYYSPCMTLTVSSATLLRIIRHLCRAHQQSKEEILGWKPLISVIAHQLLWELYDCSCPAHQVDTQKCVNCKPSLYINVRQAMALRCCHFEHRRAVVAKVSEWIPRVTRL